VNLEVFTMKHRVSLDACSWQPISTDYVDALMRNLSLTLSFLFAARRKTILFITLLCLVLLSN